MRCNNILKLSINSSERNESNPKWCKLTEKVAKAINDFQSPQGTDAIFWLKHVVWQVNSDADSLSEKNYKKIHKICHEQEIHLAPDQIEELYKQVLVKAKEAAEAPYNSDNISIKQVCFEDFRVWFQEKVSQDLISAGGNLKEKLTNANLTDLLAAANDLRIRYRRKSLKPQYLEIEREDLEDKVCARLHRLRSKADTATPIPNGRDFHQMCLEELEKVIGETKETPDWLDAYLQGFMFMLADRCVLRFAEVSP